MFICFLDNQLVTVWPRPPNSFVATPWKTIKTSHFHQMWCSSANQRAVWVYASAGSAYGTTPRLFSLWLTRTQESPAMESASTSTDLFSAAITVLEEKRAVEWILHRQRSPLKKCLIAVVEAKPLCCQCPTTVRQHLGLRLRKTLGSQLPNKSLASHHSKDGVVRRWQRGTATAHWPPCAYSAITPSSPHLGNAYIFSRGWWIVAVRG